MKMKVKKNLLTSFLQVIVVAYKNRKLPYQPPNSDGVERERREKKNFPFLGVLNKIRLKKKIKEIRKGKNVFLR